MAFNGSEGAPISLDEAATWTASYRNSLPVGSNQTIAAFAGKNWLEQILAQPGCMGIRMYFALNPSGQTTLVLTGADAAENDQVEGTLVEFLSLCPPVCGTANALNSSNT